MTKCPEIIHLAGLGLSQTNIALSCNASKTIINKVLKAAREQDLTWPLNPKLTVPYLCELLSQIRKQNSLHLNICRIMRISARSFSVME